MGVLKEVKDFMQQIFGKAEPNLEPDETITIRVKEGSHAGMKLDYGWSVRPLTDLHVPEEKLPPFVKVIIDVPENVEEEKIKIAPLGKRLVVKIPGKGRKEIDLPYRVENKYKARVENNVLFVLLEREYG